MTLLNFELVTFFLGHPLLSFGIKLSFVQNVPLVSKLIKYHFVSTCTTKYHFQLIKKLFKSLNNHSSPLWFVLIVDIKIIKGNINGPDWHIWITMDNGTLCAKDNVREGQHPTILETK